MKANWTTFLHGILFSGLGVFSYLLLVNYTDLSDRVEGVLHSARAILFFVIAFNILGYFTIRISSWVNNQYALNIRKKWKVLSIYVLVMLLFLLLNYSLLVSAKLLAGAANPFTFPNGGVGLLFTVWLVELVILGLLLANRSIQEAMQLQHRAAELQEENNVARYTALQSQLNPHFLFNSLNTLIAEIEYNPTNAVSFTRNLSNVYRYVLQCQDKALVPVAEELTFMKAYLFLHEVRLGNCITSEVEIPADCMDCLVPPLTLQLLVENIIKHNSITASKPLTIHIRVEGDYLVVSNVIHAKQSTTSSGVGLKNLSNRCKLILGKEIVIENDEKLFTVKVPLSYE